MSRGSGADTRSVSARALLRASANINFPSETYVTSYEHGWSVYTVLSPPGLSPGVYGQF